jgi:hypothetical protein
MNTLPVSRLVCWADSRNNDRDDAMGRNALRAIK